MHLMIFEIFKIKFQYLFQVLKLKLSLEFKSKCLGRFFVGIGGLILLDMSILMKLYT